MTEPSDDIDFKALRRPTREPSLPAVGAVLRFVQDDLAAIIERLSQFAIDLTGGLAVQAHHRENAAKLGTRIARLASIVREQTAENWMQAARELKGRHGKQGWSQTCWNIGMSDSALRDSKVLADRFDEAATVLRGFVHAETAATLTTLARAAAEALVRGAGEWNELMRWSKSADLAAKQEQEQPELKRMQARSSLAKPAHFELVDRLFEQQDAWARIESRLHRYPAISHHFPLAVLREHHGRGPFGVHYMAWRLGVWGTEQRFEVLEELLAHAATMRGWAGEASLLTSAEFGQYWGLVWQLQSARFLSERCSSVQWVGGAGPDLRATSDGQEVHVECYSYQKKFGPVEFLSDVLSRIDSSIRVEHNLCVPIAFTGNTSAFLDAALRPFLDGRQLADAKQRSATRWPVDLPLPAGTANLRVSVHGDDMDRFWPSLEWGTSGPPERYLEVALREVAAAKAGRNRLAESPNNVVAINILSVDFQSSLDRQIELGLPIPEPALPSDIHMATVSTCGIDAPMATFQLGFTTRHDHPGLRVLGLSAR